MSLTNKKWILKTRPKGLVEESNFELIEEAVPELNDGKILIQTEYLSVDPTQRMWLTDIPGYIPPIQIDEVIRSGGMGRVIQSNNPNLIPALMADTKDIKPLSKVPSGFADLAKGK